MHRRQGWKETTPEGEKREVRATREGRTWRIQSRLKGETEWVTHDPPDLADLESLRDLLMRKYERRRASLQAVQNVEEMIRVQRGE